MNTKRSHARPLFLFAALCGAAFLVWTYLLTVCDVRPIGPGGSSVGFAAMNGAFHDLTGVSLSLYTLTDWLGLVPVAVALCFAVLGLVLLVRRGLRGVDRYLFFLGAHYLLVAAAYLFFEAVPFNYRPVLIDGYLEASYPSSTTLLVLCVIPTAALDLCPRIRAASVRRALAVAAALFSAFMVAGRLLSGVHWLSDIVGGLFLSAALVLLYAAVCARFAHKPEVLL